MKTIQLTDLIKSKNTKKFGLWFNQIPAYSASLFSVIFSTSIVYEFKDSLNGLSLFIVGAFILSFMLINEALKIINIRKLYKGVKSSLIPFASTFLISVCIASISIYYFTNKGQILTDNSKINKSIEVNKIEQKYGLKIDSLKNINRFESSNEYKSLKNNLEYWQNRKAMTLDERNLINQNISSIQNDINKSKEIYNSNLNNNINELVNLKNKEIDILDSYHSKDINKIKTTNFLTWILVIIMLITEIGIIYLNKFIAEDEKNKDDFSKSPLAKKYVLGRYILETIYLHKDENNTTNINIAKYSYGLINNIQKWDGTTVDKWDELKGIYNLYISLGILDKGSIINDVLTNNVLMSNEDALTMYDTHHEKFFSIEF